MGIGSKILLVVALVLLAEAAVTVNQITGVSNDNLVYSGTIPVSTSTSLFFTYFGVDGQKDQSALKNYPLLIVVGK
jgi:hypothetical protein